MKHLLLCISLVFCSNAFAVDGNIDGDYNCEGQGLKISGNKAWAGILEYSLCGTRGVKKILGWQGCAPQDWHFEFDVLTYRLTWIAADKNKNDYWDCKKLK